MPAPKRRMRTSSRRRRGHWSDSCRLLEVAIFCRVSLFATQSTLRHLLQLLVVELAARPSTARSFFSLDEGAPILLQLRLEHLVLSPCPLLSSFKERKDLSCLVFGDVHGLNLLKQALVGQLLFLGADSSFPSSARKTSSLKPANLSVRTSRHKSIFAT